MLNVLNRQRLPTIVGSISLWIVHRDDSTCIAVVFQRRRRRRSHRCGLLCRQLLLFLQRGLLLVVRTSRHQCRRRWRPFYIGFIHDLRLLIHFVLSALFLVVARRHCCVTVSVCDRCESVCGERERERARFAVFGSSEAIVGLLIFTLWYTMEWYHEEILERSSSVFEDLLRDGACGKCYFCGQKFFGYDLRNQIIYVRRILYGQRTLKRSFEADFISLTRIHRVANLLQKN